MSHAGLQVRLASVAPTSVVYTNSRPATDVIGAIWHRLDVDNPPMETPLYYVAVAQSLRRQVGDGSARVCI